MHVQPTRRSSLFLLELIIAILFFSLASTVCVRFFVNSHTMEAQSMELNHAVNAATSVAEILRNTENPYASLQTEFSLGERKDDTFQIYYDEYWVPCAAKQAVYKLSLQTENTDSFLNGTIDVYKGETSLYTLTVNKYMTKEGNL